MFKKEIISNTHKKNLILNEVFFLESVRITNTTPT